MSSFVRRSCFVLFAIIAASASFAFAADSRQTFTVSKTYNNSPFEYSIKMLKDRGDFTVHRIMYPSPVVSSVKANNTVPADYYLPKKLKPGAKYPAVICLHPLDANEYLTDLLCVTVASQGMPAIAFKLPYYGDRSGGKGPDIMLESPDRFLGAISQAIEDIRRTADLLSARPEVDPKRLGVAGISLGAIVAATAAGNEPRLNRVDMILGGGDMLHVINFARETRQLRDMIENLSPQDKERVSAKIKTLDPLELAPALRERAQSGKILMINAANDEVIPPPCTEKLAKAIGMADRVVWLKGLGHYSAMAELPRAMRLTAEFFSQDLPQADRQKNTVPTVEQPAKMQKLGSFIGQIVTMLTAEPNPGLSNQADLEISFTDPKGNERTVAVKLARGAKGKFALDCKLPGIGRLALGNGQYPWLLAGGKTVLVGSKNPTIDADPFASVDPQHTMKLRMALGIGNGIIMAPAMLEQWLVVDEQKTPQPADAGCILRVTAKQAKRAPGELVFNFASEARMPDTLTFNVSNIQGKVVFRDWKTNVRGERSLFEPPADLPKKEVEQSDLIRMFGAVMNFAGDKLVPGRGPAAGKTNALAVLARDPAGHGIVCRMGSKQILMVDGTPQQMGAAQGSLVGPGMQKLADRTVYLIGALDTVNSGTWFFDRMAEIERRTSPFTPARFFDECDALAKTTGISQRDSRYANLFPERFHCSGVALRGKATAGGRVLHARVLDYMRDIDLQTSAVVQVFMPDGYNKWISLGYTGFVGSVTAMNEKGLAIGEMGGRGEGHWDGQPMSFLIRDIMERAATVDEAVEIFQKTPRTCEYYYVISDRSGEMRALECTPEKVHVLKPGQQDPRLPRVPDDTVFISGPDRAQLLSKRIQENYGKIDVQKLIEIIKRPVSMQSNLHDAIFAPETLEMWFADAGRDTPACDEPYAHVNFRELLDFYAKNSKAQK